MTARVLITGANGLIGRHAVLALKNAGFHVIAACRSGSVEAADQVLHCDLLDGDAMFATVAAAKASHLLHLAWHSELTTRWQGAENMAWIAVTVDLFRAFANAGGQRAVLAGSCAEYDWSHPMLHEGSPIRPDTAYGRAKAETGALVASLAAEMGVSHVWARIFFGYGPNETPGRLMGHLLHGIADGQEVELTDGQQQRDYLHYADIGAALVAVMQSELAGTVNVASGQAVKVRDLVELAAEKMDGKGLLRFGANARRPDDPDLLVADVGRLNSTGFQPVFNLQDGVADCIKSWKSDNS